MGYPEKFAEAPLLETVGWQDRLPLEEVVFKERYGNLAAKGEKQNG
jgi:hypothetical protein